MQEVKSSLDVARKAQQSSKHQINNTGTPYPDSRSQQDARRQWVKRNALQLEDVAIAAVAAHFSTSAVAPSALNTVLPARSNARPPKRELKAGTNKKKTKRSSAHAEQHYTPANVPATTAASPATDSRSNFPEFTDMVIFTRVQIYISYPCSYTSILVKTNSERMSESYF
jgi:hypothetical protein